MTQVDDIPDRLALLPAAAATKRLTRSVLSGQEAPPRVAFVRASKSLDGASVRWESAPVKELVDEAMRRFDGSRTRRTQADAWLAPRLHATVRMTRSEAAEPDFWNFLALVIAPEYVLWRHMPGTGSDGAAPAVPADRFIGRHYKQAFARLWWAAELFRDGPDYKPVELACGNQDVLNTTLRLDVIDHRPTALAIVQVLKSLLAAGTARLGDHINALSSAVNAAGSTLMYDVIAPEEPPDTDALLDWIRERDSAPAVSWETLPDGPEDGRAPTKSVDALVRLFEELHTNAPLRERRTSEVDEV